MRILRTTPASYDTGTRTVEVVFPWVVGALVTALLLITAQYLNRGVPPATPLGVVGLAVIGALMVAPLLALPYPPGGQSNYVDPTVFPAAEMLIVTGWAALAGGLMVVGLLGVDRPAVSGLRLTVTAAALGVGHWATGPTAPRSCPAGTASEART
ncbi:MAG: hypothetical protein WCF04_09855 [Candidatus Nanopelagicales bacterium]